MSSALDNLTEGKSPRTENPKLPHAMASKGRLNERDLIRLCVENPKYLSKTLGHSAEEGTGLETKE